MDCSLADVRAARIASLKARILCAQTAEEISGLCAEVEQLRATSVCSAVSTIGQMVTPAILAPVVCPPRFPRTSTPPPAPRTTAYYLMKNPDFAGFSRSTSSASLSTLAGSSTQSFSEYIDSSPPSPGACREDLDLIPESSYPLSVRNTFIDIRLDRDESLDDFFVDRRVFSCPVSRKGSMDEAEDVGSIGQPNATDATARNAQIHYNSDLMGSESASSSPWVHSSNSGNCKPCAFVRTKGCKSGQDCPFCHICVPLARKDKKAMLKRRRQMVGGSTMRTQASFH